MHRIPDTLSQVNARITQAANACGRDANEITLLAVSKTQNSEKISVAYATGQRDFGENYLQEALEKQAQLKQLDIYWHYIGHIQSNKTRAIAEHFSWVHTLDRIKIVERLAEQRPEYLPPLNVCIQVNIDDETNKSGCQLDQVHEIAKAISQRPQLKLRGLMAVPRANTTRESTQASFRAVYMALKTLRQNVKEEQLQDIDTLSMGMSADLESAIAEGATMVRIGTAIFGKRQQVES